MCQIIESKPSSSDVATGRWGNTPNTFLNEKVGQNGKSLVQKISHFLNEIRKDKVRMYRKSN
jgi:hypothetical protein